MLLCTWQKIGVYIGIVLQFVDFNVIIMGYIIDRLFCNYAKPMRSFYGKLDLICGYASCSSTIAPGIGIELGPGKDSFTA